MCTFLSGNTYIQSVHPLRIASMRIWSCVCEGVVYTQGCSQEFCGGRLGEWQRGQLMVCPVCGKTGFEVFTTMTSQTKFDKRV